MASMTGSCSTVAPWPFPVPVGEAMMACVLADHFLRHRGQVG
jgi:chorismate synthase